MGRWQLSRAGITNVYQYVDETFAFAGGRLLLRGVNGSGKSTAMNMLLPFLLEADTRRIDAAGEQSAVLRSWMLAGRDEQQPVGYLWIEFARDRDRDDPGGGEGTLSTEYLVCGCGIKANRSTDKVTTWWFVTDRRPGIDVALVERRVPLSIEALRSELGTHAVFAQDQRRAYRETVRERLFGGRDLDQHIRLLHVVRSPRVGDRIDTDLPEYLAASLPELSDAALDDAAQPLEDLEEHRHNVEALTKTASTLEALTAVYRSYAAEELRGRAERLIDLADQVRAAEREERQLLEVAAAATAHREAVASRIGTLETDISRLRSEIEALEASPAYQEGRQLDDLRRHVGHLEAASADAAAAVVETERRRVGAEEQARRTGSRAVDDVEVLGGHLAELDLAAREVRLSERPPPLPTIASDHTDHHAGPHGAAVPIESFDPQPFATGLGAIRGAARQRRLDVTDVTGALDEVDRLAAELAAAERDETRARDAVTTAEARLGEARAALHAALDTWRHELHEWIGRLAPLRPESRAEPSDPDLSALVDRPDLIDAGDTVIAGLAAVVDGLLDHRVGERERLAARLERERAEADALATELDELAHRTHPEPPTAAWQRADRGVCLADLVDFAPHLTNPERCGLEAAMEASGLLGAELGDDGALRLRTGELVVTAREQVDAPLSGLLEVTVPDDHLPDIDPGAVTKVLDAIATRHDQGARPPADTVVTVHGSFRIGALRGQHHKVVAEHIGITARRAAVERRRAELRERLGTANAVVEQTETELTAARLAIDTVRAHRRELPRGERVGEAMHRSSVATERLDQARMELDDAMGAVSTADEAHAAADTAAGRLAATHQLPRDRAGLANVERTLAEIAATVDRASAALDTVARSHRDWIDRIDAWRTATNDLHTATKRAQQAESALEPERSRLATLEDSIGLEYQEVLDSLDVSRTDLATATAELTGRRSDENVAIADETRAQSNVEQATGQRSAAEQRCVTSLAPMRRTLDVPGLLDATVISGEGNGSESPAIPSVATTTNGVRTLAAAVLGLVPPAERAGATAEGVRISLRQRRDQLGAGWDAEDHQPDDTLPLAVQVTGPLGRMPLASADQHARTQLRQQAGLLTAKQDQALRNLLQGLVAREVAEKMHAAGELVTLMNERLDQITTAHGIGVRLTWRRRRDLDDEGLDHVIDLLARTPDLRTADHDRELAEALSARLDTARRVDPDRRYRDLIGDVLDYRRWHELGVHVRRPGRSDERLTRRTPLSEGEKKIVSYLPLFASVAASYDALAESAPDLPRFVLLDDAFAKVSEDNHAQLFGLLVELDLDFIATSERLWGTHATVPELAITEVLRDADLGVIVLEHSLWSGAARLKSGPGAP